MFKTSPIESIDLKTIKVDIHYHEELSNSCLIILNGFIDNGIIGSEVFNTIFKHKENGRNHLLIDCNKLTYLAHTAGGSVFHGIAKLIQKDGLKMVVMNMYDEYFREEFKRFYSFVNLSNIELQKYWQKIESIINNDSLFIYRGMNES